MGKMIGGGLPLGAVGGRADVMALLSDGTVSISGTHHAHPLSIAAGYACMTQMDEAAFERLNSGARRILTEVNDRATRQELPLLAYGNGSSHIGYAILTEPGLEITNHRDIWRNVDHERTLACSLELALRGVFPVHRGEMSLSLPMTDADIDMIIDTLVESAVAVVG